MDIEQEARRGVYNQCNSTSSSCARMSDVRLCAVLIGGEVLLLLVTVFTRIQISEFYCHYIK